MKDKHNKTDYSGFRLRLSFAIILLIMAAGCSLPIFLVPKEGSAGSTMTLALGGACAALALMGVLQCVAAVKGKTKKWANTMSIVIGALFFWVYFLGLLAIFGGIKGRRAISAAQAQPAQEPQAADADGAQNTQAQSAPPQPQEPQEYIRPKLSPKAQKAMFVTVIVSYALLAVAGVLFTAIPAIGKIFGGLGICKEVSERAYAVTVGAMWLALLPSIGYYIALASPLNLGKKAKTVIMSVCGALSASTCAAFIIVTAKAEIGGLPIKAYYEGSDSWFIPVSMVFAAVGMIICYLLTLFKLNPANIKTVKPRQDGEGFFAVIKHVFACIVYGIMKFTKALLGFKEKQPEIFLFAATVLFTWLVYFTSFIFSIVMIVVLIGVLCMYFFGVIHWAAQVGQSPAPATSPTDEYYKKDSYTYTDANGYEQTVYSDDGKDFYDAGGSRVGSATDENTVNIRGNDYSVKKDG